jgi:uridine kinase
MQRQRVAQAGIMSEARRAVVRTLAELLLDRVRQRPAAVLRVAVTGITASGKSTLATELCTYALELGIHCARLPVDGFHNPRAIRYQRGRDSAEGYYRDAYNYALLKSRVLQPLAPNGSLSYTVRAFDLGADAPVDDPPEHAPPGSIVVLDASFLLRPEVREDFDYRIFVQTSFEVAEARGVQRDAIALGGEAEATRLYRTRYHEAQRLYFREARPLEHADAIVVNDDPNAPVLFTRH